MVLIAVWMAMAPIPIGSLPPIAIPVEHTILPVSFAQVCPEGMVFAVIPLVLIAMVAIVVAGMIPVAYMDYHFLGCASPGCCWGRKCGSQENKTQTFVC